MLYGKYFRRMVRYFQNGFHVSEETAEDLTQETFMRFLKAIEDYRGDAQWAFLERIAFRVGLNNFRGSKTAMRNAKTVDIDDPNVTSKLAAPSGDDYAEREYQADQRRRLHDAVSTLSPGQRQCLQLSLDDFSYDEIAKALGITLDAVRSRLRDAKKLLKERLGEDTLPKDDQ